MAKKILVETIAVLFIILFLYAAVSKLFEYHRFTVQIGQSPILTAYADYIAWIIPVLEIAISVALVSTKFKTLGFYSAFTLMTIFTAYIISITQFSDFIPCSCGGILQKMSWNQHLIFNIFFVGLGATAVLLEPAQTFDRQVIKISPVN